MNNDLISRSALKKLKVYSEERREYVVPVYNIDNAPTIEDRDLFNMGYFEGKKIAGQQKGEWVPVNEGLPERYKEVIVTDIETSDTYISRHLGNGFWECDNEISNCRVIAWQPKPEPYKEAGDNKITSRTANLCDDCRFTDDCNPTLIHRDGVRTTECSKYEHADMQERLMPCPYCGNTGPALYHYMDGFIVQCGRYLCDSKFAFRAPTKEECIKMWNRNADLINKNYEGRAGQ